MAKAVSSEGWAGLRLPQKHCVPLVMERHETSVSACHRRELYSIPHGVIVMV